MSGHTSVYMYMHSVNLSLYVRLLYYNGAYYVDDHTDVAI